MFRNSSGSILCTGGEEGVCSSGMNDQQSEQSVSRQIIKAASLSCLSMIDDLKGQLIDQLTSCQMVG